MPLLIATPKATDANSYCTVARADLILARRLYTTKWDTAASTPDAENYQTSQSGNIGDPHVHVDTGTGSFTTGCKIKLAGHDTVYTITNITGNSQLQITPSLTANVANDEKVERITANQKEKALIMATTVFESNMDWYGIKRTELQRLRWPRSGVLDYDGDDYDPDTIPELLELATMEYALVLLERNVLKRPAILGQGIAEAQVGPMKVKTATNQEEPPIPTNILAMLSPLGAMRPDGNPGSRVIPMRRV